MVEDELCMQKALAAVPDSFSKSISASRCPDTDNQVNPISSEITPGGPCLVLGWETANKIHGSYPEAEDAKPHMFISRTL